LAFGRHGQWGIAAFLGRALFGWNLSAWDETGGELGARASRCSASLAGWHAHSRHRFAAWNPFFW